MIHPRLAQTRDELKAKYADPYKMIQLPGLTRDDVELIIVALLEREASMPMATSSQSILAQSLIARSYSTKPAPYVHHFVDDFEGEDK
jgi:hypothetical protein